MQLNLLVLLLRSNDDLPNLHSFPTRRSSDLVEKKQLGFVQHGAAERQALLPSAGKLGREPLRSEEHTSELQSRRDIVCRLLLEKKKNAWWLDEQPVESQ